MTNKPDIEEKLDMLAIRWLSIVNHDFPYDSILVCFHNPIISIYMDSGVYEYTFNIPEKFHNEWKDLIESESYKKYFKENFNFCCKETHKE